MDDLRFGLSISWDERRVCIHGLPEQPKLKFAILIEDGFVVEGDHLVLTLTSVQKCSMSVSAVDAKGNPAEVENVTFTASDPAILTIEPDATDATKATVLAAGPLGNAQVVVAADADIGEGTKPLQGILDVIVVAAEAVSLSVATGTPEDQ
jgi:hypothetical protein